jgi:acid phosphatase family membrane protein YuiD
MNPFEPHHFGNIFYITGLSWAIAQGLKVLIYYFKHHKINFRLFIGMGGMPSSHSAFVCSLATTIGIDTRWDSAAFWLAVGVALIVMTDAAGVRRAAGQQAKILNQMLDDLEKSRPIPQQRLKELLGHTPTQVFAGAALGILFSFALYPLIH